MGGEEEQKEKKSKKMKEKNKEEGEGEGQNLLGLPTFTELQNGRLKCVETGHELLPADKEMYSRSKRCRLGLIDFAVSKNKPPLNMFQQDPLNRSRLICKLTGDTVNKSEEHIWKHLNGKRFLNKLEQMEMGKLEPNGEVREKDVDDDDEEDEDGDKKKKKNKQKKNKKKKEKKAKGKEEVISEVRDSADKDSDSEEPDFWFPPVGDRWDFDDGGDRWGSGNESGQEDEEENDAVLEDSSEESKELSKRTKRMAIEIGPSSYASRKKKSKKEPTC